MIKKLKSLPPGNFGGIAVVLLFIVIDIISFTTGAHSYGRLLYDLIIEFLCLYFWLEYEIKISKLKNK
jgi:hypothetical protein